jgi:hypothetical protein
MLKIPAEYERDISSAKFTAISCQVTRDSLLGVSAVLARELWWMNQELLELRWGRKIDQKMAAVHGMLCTIPPRDSNQ